MAKALAAVLWLVALAGCTLGPQVQGPAGPCSLGESSYECQVQRYHDVAQ
jgi:hypothetical protein